MRRLPPSERDVLLLSGLGYSAGEIAEALGRTVKTVTQQLYMARRKVLEELGKRGAVIGVLPLRWRLGFDRRARELGWLSQGQNLAVSTLVPLMASWALSAPSPALPSASPHAALQLPTSTSLALNDGAGGSSSHTESRAPAVAAAPAADQPDARNREHTARDGTVPGLAALPPDGPETTYVTSVAPSPHYQQDHTVLALGSGQRCGCTVLFRSTDGGASWTKWAAVGVTGTQVALSAQYPADPRIFVGADPSTFGVDWVSPGWGKPFAALTFPPGAAGRLAAVDGHIYSAGLTAVWSLAGSVATPVVTYQGVAPATLATNADTVFILAPPYASRPGSVMTAKPSLLACSPTCRLLTTLDLPAAGPIAASGSVVAAAAGARVLLSTDGGHAFEDVSPTAVAGVQALSATGDAVWRVSTSAVDARSIDTAGVWTHVHVDQAVAAIIPLSSRRILAQLADGGILCSDDGGTSWAERCPPTG